jgi:hypothetical protein
MAESPSLRRFVPVTLLMPVLGAVLGTGDGGLIFQILAVDNLNLGSTTIGIAFGLGVVSLPVQIFASRIPLRHARRNTQLFLVIAALQAWVLALLIAIGATGRVASIALAVTVAAEISVSVLFATSWQPLLSALLGSTARQRLNTTWPAIARGALAVSLVAFAAFAEQGRVAFLIGVGGLAAACALSLRRIPMPGTTLDSLSDERVASHPTGEDRDLPDRTRMILAVFGAINVGAAPLWLVYLHDVLWPTANLGLVAGVQTVASMLALLAWRSTDGDVARRAFVAVVALATAAVVLAALPAPVTTPSSQAVLLIITATMGAGVTAARIAMLESAHRAVSVTNSVRVFTILDVVASTSLQAGSLLGGFLIASSRTTVGWPIDPYKVFLLAASGFALMVTARFVNAQSVE